MCLLTQQGKINEVSTFIISKQNSVKIRLNIHALILPSILWETLKKGPKLKVPFELCLDFCFFSQSTPPAKVPLISLWPFGRWYYHSPSPFHSLVFNSYLHGSPVSVMLQGRAVSLMWRTGPLYLKGPLEYRNFWNNLIFCKQYSNNCVWTIFFMGWWILDCHKNS